MLGSRSNEGVAGIPHGHMDAMVTRKRLSYTVGTKLHAVEVALKRTTKQNILYGVSGLLCCNNMFGLHHVHCSPPVLCVASPSPIMGIQTDVTAFHYTCLLIPACQTGWL